MNSLALTQAELASFVRSGVVKVPRQPIAPQNPRGGSRRVLTDEERKQHRIESVNRWREKNRKRGLTAEGKVRIRVYRELNGLSYDRAKYMANWRARRAQRENQAAA